MSDQIPTKNLDDQVDGVQQLEPEKFHLYQKREKIYTRKIEGFFQRVRLFTGWPLLLGYFLIPWINWDSRQSVYFNLPERQFNVFGITFWPQDFMLLAWTLIICAFGLFFITTWLGRIWCGYTCPQTVWTSIFMWAEQVTEGDRNARMKLDKQPWSSEKVIRKTLKHGMWLGFALLTGLTFVGYFSPIRELVVNLVTFNLGSWEAFWIVFFTLATYGNAGWLREQVCMYMCPYARFQASMFDKDTLIVSYDPARGEPRGPRKRDLDYRGEGLGDCVDCQMCVQVCPTGIDIRDGLQYECINCALCIDACNDIMDKMEYPRGLIRYTTENRLEGKESHLLRPKLVGYALAMVVMISLFTYTITGRTPLQLDVSRDRAQLYVQTPDGLVQNNYSLKVLNMSQATQSYQITMTGLDNGSLTGNTQVTIEGGGVEEIPVIITVDPGLLEQPNTSIDFVVTSIDGKVSDTAESRFIGPRLIR